MDDSQEKTQPGDERLVGVLWQTWRQLPARTRLSMAATLAIVAVGLQVAAGFEASDPERAAAKVVANVAGTGGAPLYGERAGLGILSSAPGATVLLEVPTAGIP